MTPEQLLEYAIRQAKMTPHPAKPVYIKKPQPPKLIDAIPSPKGLLSHPWHHVLQTFSMIASRIALDNGLSMEELRGRRRSITVARPRQLAQYLTVKVTGRSTTEIAKYYGRDHSSITNSVHVIAKRMINDERFRTRVETLRQEFDEYFNREEVSKEQCPESQEPNTSAVPTQHGEPSGAKLPSVWLHANGTVSRSSAD